MAYDIDNRMVVMNMLVILVLVFSSLSSVHAYQFVVGGKQGWVLNPSENYNHWAERMRFQVNDTLLFTYNNASDSVLVMDKNGYDKCDTSNPIQKFDDGSSIFTFDRSGPFYFISGNKSNCDQGEKMIIVVLAMRNGPSPPSSPSGPPPSASTPSPSPTSPSGPTASSPAPSPENQTSGPSPATTGLAPGASTSPRSGGGPANGNGSPTAGGNTPADGNTTPGSGGGGSRPSSWGLSTCLPSFVLLLVGWLISIGGL